MKRADCESVKETRSSRPFSIIENSSRYEIKIEKANLYDVKRKKPVFKLKKGNCRKYEKYREKNQEKSMDNITKEKKN